MVDEFIERIDVLWRVPDCKADTVTKDYVKNVDIFADVFNYYIYGGRQVVQPEQLIERDTAKVALPYGADGAAISVQRFHDAQKLYAAMTDEEIMKFQSSLREVMFFIKYSRNKEKLNEVLESNQRRFQRLEKRAVDVIEAIINAGIKYDEGEVEVDMCQAIQEIREEERRLGELEKTKEAARNFYEMGIEIEKVAQGVGYTVETVKQWLGLAEDRQKKGILISLQNLMECEGWSLERAMAALGIPEPEKP